jgi:predicted GTPase
MFKKLHDAIDQFTPAVLPTALAATGLTQAEYDALRAKLLAARETPPRIALIGETGVGKSSTINALFNKNVPVSHSRACTTHETELTVKRGKLKVVDMPGLGEDVDRDREHMELYQRTLPGCDVVLWILKADNRAFTGIQRSLAELIASSALDPRRLVVGVNQVDALQPDGWNTRFNIPSREQEATLTERLADVSARLAKVQGLGGVRIIPYSALKNYRLPDLLTAITDAAEMRVRWVLGELADLQRFDATAAHSEA